MNLEELKKKANLSELSLITMVEDLVRSEYDVVKLKKEIKNLYHKQVVGKVLKLMEDYRKDFTCIARENPNTERTIKNFLGSVGSIIREEDDKEI